LGIERLGHGRRFCWTAEGDRRDLAVSPIASLGQAGDALDEAIGAIDRELAASVKADETANRLMTIPGVGPVTASAIMATIQDASARAGVSSLPSSASIMPNGSVCCPNTS
jgi:transposase